MTALTQVLIVLALSAAWVLSYPTIADSIDKNRGIEPQDAQEPASEPEAMETVTEETEPRSEEPELVAEEAPEPELVSIEQALSALTVKQLRSKAKQLGIPVPSRIRKADLVAMLA